MFYLKPILMENGYTEEKSLLFQLKGGGAGQMKDKEQQAWDGEGVNSISAGTEGGKVQKQVRVLI